MKKVTRGLFLAIMCVFSGTTIAQNVSGAINQQLSQSVKQKELNSQDTQWQITSESVSSTSGVQHVYYRQLFNGIEIYGTESGIHMLSNGQVISKNNKFIKNTTQKLVGSNSPALSAIQAVQSAAAKLNYSISKPLTILEGAQGLDRQTLISDGGISKSPIPAKLIYAITETNQLVLSWDISIQENSQQDWWSLRIDANTGAIVNKANWMVSCATHHDHSNDVKEMNYNTNLYDIPNYAELKTNAPLACVECYEVIALPLESPYYGARTILVQPANATASPFGWHDTDGVAGAEFTTTRGNNVNAYEDGNNSGYQPNGGANLDFSGFPFSQVYNNANQYEDAAITNLFYMNNAFHDVMYQYGFDEVSGNFQEKNYSNLGLGSDSVNGEAQDGSGTCNANFGTPPDGGNPTMQMYICGDKDGDFDNLVIMHEYGHGISNRLTGGPGNAGCLQNQEQMGEGWSDFFGVLLTIQAGDVGTDGRAVGTYLFGQGQGGGGIRDFPYSTDMTVNPQTYNFIKTAAVPHGVGSVWAEMLWEVTWALIDEHGYDADFYNFTGDVNQDAGNIMALALVTEGMKLQPCGPGFVDGRDAIFAADQALYGGANECLLWTAFAKRGLGYSATQGSSNSRSDGTQAFDLPSPDATGVAGFCLGDPVTVTATPINPANSIEWYDALTGGALLFSGASYTFTPTASINVYAEEVPAAGESCFDRALAAVTIETVDPDITCPANITVQVPQGEQFTLLDYTTDATATDNCSQAPVITQSPIAGTMVGVGVTTMTMTATDAAGNDDTCTFTVTVEELLGLGDSEFYNNISLYPNPTTGQITLMNKTTALLINAVITDVNGRTIKTIDLSKAGMETNFSLQNLATGMYFIKINAENTSVVKRIVKL